MRLVRGALASADRDAAVTRQLAAFVERTGQPGLRVWQPTKQVAFGRRDANSSGYEHAREAARERGYETVERDVGGHAVAYTGATVAFAHLVPMADDRTALDARYERAIERLASALDALGVDPVGGEPPASFCPGAHSLQRDGKIAGLAQRVRRESAVVGGCVVVTERDETAIADVLSPVYDALDLPFAPESVGSVEGAGGAADPDVVGDAVESAFVAGRSVDVVDARATVD